jgi:hypothetical protein
MVFYPPKRVPQLPGMCLCRPSTQLPCWDRRVLTRPEIPDSITVEEFISDEQYGRYPLDQSRSPYTCGLTGKTYTPREVKQRTDFLARGIGKRLGFHPHVDTEWDRVVALFSHNTACLASLRTASGSGLTK